MNHPIFIVTSNDVLKILSLRTDISKLSPEDIRPYIEIGLDV